MKKLNPNADGYDFQEKLNEIVDWINIVSADFEFELPKRMESQRGFNSDGQKILTKSEWKVIKKCLRYCQHRLYVHEFSGIHLALSQEDKRVFEMFTKKM
jgi:hypothetical protein